MFIVKKNTKQSAPCTSASGKKKYWLGRAAFSVNSAQS